MTFSPLYLAAVAVSALNNVEIVATRPPHITTPDYQIGGVLDAQGRHWVVKLPLNSIAGASLEAEASLADSLVVAVDEGLLPFDVIRPKAFTTLSSGGRAMVYREPFGSPLNLENVDVNGARSIGRALGALHELDPNMFEQAGVPVYNATGLRDRLANDLEEVSRTKRVPSSLLSRWDRWLETEELWAINAVPVHGDLDEDNVMSSNGNITAMTGFGEAHVGDPAEDFVWLANSLDDDIFDVITESYAMSRSIGGDNFLLERVTLHSEFALAKWLLHGVRIGSEEIQHDAHGMLRELEDSIASDPSTMAGPRWRVDPTLTAPTTTSAAD